jgi:hypothetical protein
MEVSMRLTLRAIVLVLIGIVVGSLVRPVHAQPDGGPFQVGQRLTLSYVERGIDCTVQDIRGTFLRCEAPKPDPFMRFPVYVVWYNTLSTESISIRDK